MRICLSVSVCMFLLRFGVPLFYMHRVIIKSWFEGVSPAEDAGGMTLRAWVDEMVRQA